MPPYGEDPPAPATPCLSPPATPRESPPLRIKVSLSDGSWIFGRPAITSLLATTSYGNIELPLHGIRTITFKSSYSGPLPVCDAPVLIGGSEFQPYHHP